MLRSCLDHSALLVFGFPINSLGPQPFRFHLIWIEHPDFEKVVKDAWHSVDFFDPTRSILSKLRALKIALRSWNVVVFGNIHARVDNARANLSAIQCSISSGGNLEQLYNNEVAAKLELLQAVRNQSIFLKEKARVRWLTDGDWCTKFFHAYCRIKMARSSINSLLIDGVLNSNPVEIFNHLVSYYVKLYLTTPSVEDPTTVCSVIPHLVYEANNALLTEVPSASEIKDIVFATDPNSAPGLDVFSGLFYQHYWHIIASNVVCFVQHFFTTGKLPQNFNSNFIVLIPKDGCH